MFRLFIAFLIIGGIAMVGAAMRFNAANQTSKPGVALPTPTPTEISEPSPPSPDFLEETESTTSDEIIPEITEKIELKIIEKPAPETTERVDEKTEETPTPIPEPDTIFCNNKYWALCSAGKNFYCPENGEAQCIEEPKEYYVEAKPIYLRSIAGIQCNFENDKGERLPYRGSGAFIHPDGYILAVRHLVDPEWTKWAYNDQTIDTTYNRLIDCEVHFLDSDRIIALTDTPPYPYFDLHKMSSGIQYDFKAKLVYLPDTTQLSENENQQLDYAILKITEKNPTKYFPQENPKIQSSPILIPSQEQWLTLIKGQKITIPGYAYQATGAGAFDEYRLLTKDGKISEIFSGDEFFKDKPFVIETELSPDVYGGRSGSPIFYKGYIIGLIQVKADPTKTPYLTGYQTGINAVVENLTSRLESDIKKVFWEPNYFQEK